MEYNKHSVIGLTPAPLRLPAFPSVRMPGGARFPVRGKGHAIVGEYGFRRGSGPESLQAYACHSIGRCESRRGSHPILNSFSTSFAAEVTSPTMSSSNRFPDIRLVSPVTLTDPIGRPSWSNTGEATE